MTNSAADPGVAVDAGRIKYVTEHFQQLQGLGTAALGASWTMIELVMDLRRPDSWLICVALAICAVFTMGAVLWAYRTDYFDRYYRRRFGAIEPKPVPSRSGVPSKSGIFAALFAFVAVIVAVSALRLEQFLLLAFSLSSVGTLLGMLRSREKSGDPRNMYLLPANLAMVWIYSYPMWHTPDSGHAAVWKILVDFAMPVFFLVTGLCDHLLLLRLMPKRISEDDYDG
jgi:hypothetical protein